MATERYPEAELVGNPLTPCQAIVIDPDRCTGCNRCVDACRTDVLMPNAEAGKPPLVTFPDECWFDACCVAECPVEGAIRMEHPLMQRMGWKRKETGEYFRRGMKDPPRQTYTKPASGS
jgi:NAD-dependent dihydropyrimidine dehydrogenase PreA subunit